MSNRIIEIPLSLTKNDVDQLLLEVFFSDALVNRFTPASLCFYHERCNPIFIQPTDSVTFVTLEKTGKHYLILNKRIIELTKIPERVAPAAVKVVPIDKPDYRIIKLLITEARHRAYVNTVAYHEGVLVPAQRTFIMENIFPLMPALSISDRAIFQTNMECLDMCAGIISKTIEAIKTERAEAHNQTTVEKKKMNPLNTVGKLFGAALSGGTSKALKKQQPENQSTHTNEQMTEPKTATEVIKEEMENRTRLRHLSSKRGIDELMDSEASREAFYRRFPNSKHMAQQQVDRLRGQHAEEEEGQSVDPIAELLDFIKADVLGKQGLRFSEDPEAISDGIDLLIEEMIGHLCSEIYTDALGMRTGFRREESRDDDSELDPRDFDRRYPHPANIRYGCRPHRDSRSRSPNVKAKFDIEAANLMGSLHNRALQNLDHRHLRVRTGSHSNRYEGRDSHYSRQNFIRKEKPMIDAQAQVIFNRLSTLETKVAKLEGSDLIQPEVKGIVEPYAFLDVETLPEGINPILEVIDQLEESIEDLSTRIIWESLHVISVTDGAAKNYTEDFLAANDPKFEAAMNLEQVINLWNEIVFQTREHIEADVVGVRYLRDVSSSGAYAFLQKWAVDRVAVLNATESAMKNVVADAPKPPAKDEKTDASIEDALGRNDKDVPSRRPCVPAKQDKPVEESNASIDKYMQLMNESDKSYMVNCLRMADQLKDQIAEVRREIEVPPTFTGSRMPTSAVLKHILKGDFNPEQWVGWSLTTMLSVLNSARGQEYLARRPEYETVKAAQTAFNRNMDTLALIEWVDVSNKHKEAYLDKLREIRSEQIQAEHDAAGTTPPQQSGSV